MNFNEVTRAAGMNELRICFFQVLFQYRVEETLCFSVFLCFRVCLRAMRLRFRMILKSLVVFVRTMRYWNNLSSSHEHSQQLFTIPRVGFLALYNQECSEIKSVIRDKNVCSKITTECINHAVTTSEQHFDPFSCLVV